MRIRAITITGEVCTGKSTIANALLQRLPDWEQANTGQKFREICAARGISIQEVASLPDDVHRAVDDWQRSLAATESNIIIEGRLAGWLARDMEHVFRVYCYSDLGTRIQRYMQRENVSAERARKEIEYRDSHDVEKYRRVYNLPDYRDASFYNLQLDTSRNTPEELAWTIIRQASLVPDGEPEEM